MAQIQDILASPYPIGITDPDTVDTTYLKAIVEDTNTASVIEAGEFRHDVNSGTPAAGLGVSVRLKGETTTTAGQTQGRIVSEWVDATHASRKGRLSLFAFDTAAREGLRIEASGSAVKLGFFGTAAVVQPANDTDLKDALVNLGLYASGGATPLNLDGGTLTAGAFDAGPSTLRGEGPSDAVKEVLNCYNSNTSAAGGAGLGPAILLGAETSTTQNVAQARIYAHWTNATHASREARLTLTAYDTAERIGLQIEANGTVAKVSFFGVAPFARPTTYAAMTGSGNRATVYDTSSITLVQLATRVKAIQDDLTSYGLLG